MFLFYLLQRPLSHFLGLLGPFIIMMKLQCKQEVLFVFRPSRCKMLNLHRNHLVCLRQLPKLPAVEHLTLSENAISSLRGLGALGSSQLRSLNLTRNPVTFSLDYRAQWVKKGYNNIYPLDDISICCFFSFYSVFSCLPNLEVLDGIPKLPGDLLPLRVKGPETSRMCNIL